MTFGLNVTYKMKPGMREEFLTALAQSGLPEIFRQENGCLQYSYFRSVEDEDCLLLVERWTDRDAQKRHLETPHIPKLAAIKERCVLDTSLTVYDL